MTAKEKPLKKIEPPLPIYSVFVTNGSTKIFYGMMIKEDAYELVKKKTPEVALKEIEKDLSGNIRLIVEEKLP